MANDVYVKFGSDPSPALDGPLNTEIPQIEGDSTDAHHWWWCELRECGFDMETPQQEDQAQETAANKPASGFKPVTLRKRVDWASTQLFLKCCESAMATVNKSTDDLGKGRINDVTVEVCRPAGGDKVPSVTVIYYGVRITRYAIAITEPEPAENITFEFDKVKFIYHQTDPWTGALKTGAVMETEILENHHPQPTASGAQSSGGTAGGSGSGGSAAPASGSAAPAAGGSPTAGVIVPAVGAAPPTPGAAPDPTVTVNFPGLWQGTGFGLLPD